MLHITKKDRYIFITTERWINGRKKLNNDEVDNICDNMRNILDELINHFENKYIKNDKGTSKIISEITTIIISSLNEKIYIKYINEIKNYYVIKNFTKYFIDSLIKCSYPILNNFQDDYQFFTKNNKFCSTVMNILIEKIYENIDDQEKEKMKLILDNDINNVIDNSFKFPSKNLTQDIKKQNMVFS